MTLKQSKKAFLGRSFAWKWSNLGRLSLVKAIRLDQPTNGTRKSRWPDKAAYDQSHKQFSVVGFIRWRADLPVVLIIIFTLALLGLSASSGRLA